MTATSNGPFAGNSPGAFPPVSLVLASASPARLATLRAAGVRPRVVVSGVDEATVDDPDPGQLCARLAQLKAEAVAGRADVVDPARAQAGARTLVLGCDSVLAFDGQVLGKPADAETAARRWRAMRGRTGVLHTGHCLIDAGSGQSAREVAATTVHFAELTDDEIASYVATGEPLHVAGAFTIDGLGGWFIERIEGDHGTVIGVSLPLLRRLLAALGLRVADLWPVRAPG